MGYLHFKDLEIPLYRGSLIIVLTNDNDKLVNILPSFPRDKNIYGHTWHDNWKGDNGYFIILNFDNDYRKIYNGIITHEAIHATHMIAAQRGFVSDFDNDEPIAYLAEWITDQVYKFMYEHKKKASV